jgi:uncharacterized protein (TIGR03083 family)
MAVRNRHAAAGPSTERGPGAVRVEDVPRIGHAEAMALTEQEDARFAEALRELAPSEWGLPTDCTGWDVRALAVHVTASAQAQASPLEFARQVVAGRPLTREIGGSHWVDGVNEAQLRARASWTPQELPQRWVESSGRALRSRRRMPAPLRALPLLPLGSALGTDLGWQPLGYLFDIGFTRDVWMHRVDLARAVGRAPRTTPEHDGRIVADIVAEWSTLHDEDFLLRLTGPAGGTYLRGAPSSSGVVEVDAVECCRVLSGRAEATGPLRHRLPL